MKGISKTMAEIWDTLIDLAISLERKPFGAEFYERRTLLDERFLEIDREFEVWFQKEMKAIEYGQHCADGDPVSDDRILGRECLGTGEGESGIQRAAWQDYGRDEDGSREYAEDERDEDSVTVIFAEAEDEDEKEEWDQWEELEQLLDARGGHVRL